MCVTGVFLCVFQFSSGVQLLSAVRVLHHPRTPESRKPRSLHPGRTPFFPLVSPLVYTYTNTFMAAPVHIVTRCPCMHAVSLAAVHPCVLAYVLFFTVSGADSHVSRWEDSGVVDCAGNHRHDALILIAIP